MQLNGELLCFGTKNVKIEPGIHTFSQVKSDLQS